MPGTSRANPWPVPAARSREGNEIIRCKNRGRKNQQGSRPEERDDKPSDVASRLDWQSPVVQDTPDHDDEVGKPGNALENEVGSRRIFDEFGEKGRREHGQRVPEACRGGVDELAPTTQPDAQKKSR